MIVSIYEVFAMFIELLMNRYVFAYIVLPGLVVAGIIKYYKEQGNPVFNPVLKFLAVYYAARTMVVIFLW